MGKIGARINALAKKASSYGGKLGIIARAVDAVIPDNEQDAKTSQVSGDTNEGSANSTKSMRAKANEPGADASTSTPPAKKTFKEMWSSWGMGVKVGMIALPVLIIVWAMTKGKKTGGNSYRFKRK